MVNWRYDTRHGAFCNHRISTVEWLYRATVAWLYVQWYELTRK